MKLNSELKIYVLIKEYYGLNHAGEIAAHPNIEFFIFGIIDCFQYEKVRLVKAVITHSKIAGHNDSMTIDNLDTIYKEAKT